MTSLRLGLPIEPVLASPWSLRTVAAHDVPLVHEWMRNPHVAARWKQDWPLPRWQAELDEQLAGDRSRPCLVSRAGRPTAYTEVYWVARDRLAAHLDHSPYDLGVHLAIGSVSATGRGLGTELAAVIPAGIFAAHPLCTRVVAEPDETNGPMLGCLLSAGWVREGTVVLPHKTAAIMVRHRTA